MRTGTVTDIRTFASQRTVPFIVPASGSTSYRPLRCRGEVQLPSGFSMDVARLLDIDPAVEHWRCQVPLIGVEGVADFVTDGPGGQEHLLRHWVANATKSPLGALGQWLENAP